MGFKFGRLFRRTPPEDPAIKMVVHQQLEEAIRLLENGQTKEMIELMRALFRDREKERYIKHDPSWEKLARMCVIERGMFLQRR
jgi:hypothetical protein